MVFRAIPILEEIFFHPTLPYFSDSLDFAQIRGVGRTIFDWELFHVDLDDALIFGADTDNLSIEPVFDDVVFEDIGPNFDDHDNEPLFDTEFDKGPVFDTESIPDHVVISVFEFVRLEYDAELTIFDTDSNNLNDLPLFDTEPVHDVELAMFNQGNDGSSTAHTSVLDGHPIFDVEAHCLSYVDDMVFATFKEGPIFDKEPVVEAVQKESGRDYYTAHGENATFIARTYFHTISALLHLGSGSDWMLTKSGKPGNIGRLDLKTFADSQMLDQQALLALCLPADCEKSINSHSLLQDAISKCSILLTERKNLGKIRGSVKLVRDLISQFDYSLGALGALLSYAELLANDTNYGNYTLK
ncbi:hypothetical protein ACJX0J_042026, partial [Zea mays]